MNFSTYPKIMVLGQRGTEEIFKDQVEVTEKCDGCNCRVMNDNGKLRVGSHKRELSLDSDVPDAKMFTPFTNWVKEKEEKLLKLLPSGTTLFGEMCQNHNVLKYKNTFPIVLFNVGRIEEYGLDFVSAEFQEHELSKLSLELGVPLVPVLYKGKIGSREQLDKLLDTQSFMGGTKIEGIVIKNYNQLNQFGRPIFAKIVSQEFKEDHRDKRKSSNTTSLEEKIVEKYFNEARLRKSIQHLREDGTYDGSPRDIGNLLKHIPKDIYSEAKEEIKEMLFDKYWKQISRMICGRIPQAYKNYLEKELFKENNEG